MTVNINRDQSDICIKRLGHNPANVYEIDTAIDTELYKYKNKREKIHIAMEIHRILSGGKKRISVSSIGKVIEKQNQSVDSKPLFIGLREGFIDNFWENNIVLLQPTRIILRKRIQDNFKLIQKMFADNDFRVYFDAHSQVRITLLVSGPIPTGQKKYFLRILSEYERLLNNIDKKFSNRLNLAFLFSAFDDPEYIKKTEAPIDISDLYSIASLVLLPSETEGRGLPLIESGAAGVPIFTRRYEPENVFASVIGEHLEAQDRLKVIEFNKQGISREVVEKVLERILYPQMHFEELEHNRNVIEKRYSLKAFRNNIELIIQKLHLQLTVPGETQKEAVRALAGFERSLMQDSVSLKAILKSEKRQYLPGYGQLNFMIYLKSLIDPSFFRVEEHNFKGLVFDFARLLIETNRDPQPLPVSTIHYFYNCVEQVFTTKKGEMPVRIDHSFSYRHRNRDYYPYRDRTFQELTGVVNSMFRRIIEPAPMARIDSGPLLLSDWKAALGQITNAAKLGIDNRDRLVKRLKENVPIVYFLGKYIKDELDLFIIQPMRTRLKLGKYDVLEEKHLKNKNIAPICIIAHKESSGTHLSLNDLKLFISKSKNEDMLLLLKSGVCRIIGTEQTTVGIHVLQLGEEALKVLVDTGAKNGFVIAMGEHSSLMTDFMEIERFHIGKIMTELASGIMGIPVGAGFVQWLPAGLRAALSYPTPIQTAKSLDDTLNSKRFRGLCCKIGEKNLLKKLSMAASDSGAPVEEVINRLLMEGKRTERAVDYSSINGIYNDKLPWSGMVATVRGVPKKRWKFIAVSGRDNKTETVPAFLKRFNRNSRKKGRIAWNGGYILNPELVGKLGLSEAYIGTPLGLLIVDGIVESPPLFNKPAFILNKKGTLDIRRVNCSGGITLIEGRKKFLFPPGSLNLKANLKGLCYYNLMYGDRYIPGDGRVIIRVSGRKIQEVIKTKPGERVEILPIGLHFSFPRGGFPQEFNKIGKKINIVLDGFDDISYAIEAGPMLLDDGKTIIDMKKEGWKTENSIRTQAARIDFTDMRGPKIAIGLNKKGELSVLTINGRIRESVGATHFDMANILRGLGIEKAMGFDPGGSSTLVVDGKLLNISPYNHNYENNIYTQPPEPRAVANVVIGYLEDK